MNTTLPDNSTVVFTFTSDEVEGCYASPAFIAEVNLVPSGSGSSLVGKIRAPADQKISGPISVDINPGSGPWDQYLVGASGLRILTCGLRVNGRTAHDSET